MGSSLRRNEWKFDKVEVETEIQLLSEVEIRSNDARIRRRNLSVGEATQREKQVKKRPGLGIFTVFQSANSSNRDLSMSMTTNFICSLLN